MRAPSLRLTLGFAALTLLWAGLSLTPAPLNLEQKTGLRWLFLLRGPVTPPEQMVIVALNSTTAERLHLPRQSATWPRTLHAELLSRLHQAGAQLIVMDIAFKDPRTELEDQALQAALSQAGNVILFEYLLRHQIATGQGLLDVEQAQPPLPRFAEQALAVGGFVLPKYPANVSHAYLFSEMPQGLAATQPLLAYLAQQPHAVQQILWHSLYGTEAALPQDLQQRALGFRKAQAHPAHARLNAEAAALLRVFQQPNPIPVQFYGGPQTLRTLALDEVLQQNPDQLRQTFAGKTVFVGYSDLRQTEQQDAYRTVFSDALGADISGVEISATVAANLLQGSYLRTPSPIWLLSLHLGALLLPLAMSPMRPLWQCLLIILGASAYGFVALGVFRQHFVWLPLLTPALALLSGQAVVWHHTYREQKRREAHIRKALSQYVPDKVANQLSRSFQRLEQQHQLVQGVCLLTDIQGYTRLAETLPPTELHSLMNAYYERMVQCVEQHGGFVGNIVGDSLLALWTGPSITEQMCTQALNAAHAMQACIAEHPQWQNQLPTCYALHGGQFSLGNLGGTGHFEYSPVGDMINTASRIEHFNRQLGTRLLCSQPIAERLPRKAPNTGPSLLYLGAFELRNKNTAVGLYTETNTTWHSQFAQALQLYENGDLTSAKMQFERLAELYDDGPSRYYLTLCQESRTP